MNIKAGSKSKLFEGGLSFEKRKADHIHWSLSDESQVNLSPSQLIQLPHDPLPEVDFPEVDSLSSFSKLFPQNKPYLISSMTGGHGESSKINHQLLKAAAEHNWLFSTGSLRREIQDESFHDSEWISLREEFKDAVIIGNIGLAQILDEKERQALFSYLEKVRFDALFVHLNPLQEALQKEGTPFFKNGKQALQNLRDSLKIPLLIKETGTGFSRLSIQKLLEIDLDVLDISGFGGTHWGRIEGLRADEKSKYAKAAHVFKHWGHSTVQSLLDAQEVLSKKSTELWASGGIRSGLDAAICFALGAEVVGFAKPFIEAIYSDSPDSLEELIEQIEYEVQVALFCTGSQSIRDLQTKGGWSWKK